MNENVIDKWHSGFSNYVIAGGDTICSLFTAFLAKHNWDNIFDDQQYKTFLHNSIDRFLFSFGTGLNYKTQKIQPKHVEKIVSTIDFMRSSKFMDDCTLYIDSGGFQVAMGGVKVSDMPKFMDMYFGFLNISNILSIGTKQDDMSSNSSKSLPSCLSTLAIIKAFASSDIPLDVGLNGVRISIS